MFVALTNQRVGHITQYSLLEHGGWSTQSLATSKLRRCTRSVAAELAAEVGWDGKRVSMIQLIAWKALL